MDAVCFLHIPGNFDLLKAELSEIVGEFRPSFMAPGFSTFIIDQKAHHFLKKNKPKLALAMGFNAKRVDHAPNVIYQNQELIFTQGNECYYQDPKGQVWHVFMDDFEMMATLAQIKTPAHAPSRAWLKIAQAFQLYPKSRQGEALEIGSAPGGAACFLLSQNLKLVGIDPGEMDPLILNDLSFIHLKKPVQEISKNDLPRPFSLIAVDTNLPSGASMREALRLADFSKETLQELFLTIKLPSPRLVRGLSKYQRELSKMNFKSCFIQLPSHHREILLYGYR